MFFFISSVTNDPQTLLHGVRPADASLCHEASNPLQLFLTTPTISLLCTENLLHTLLFSVSSSPLNTIPNLFLRVCREFCCKWCSVSTLAYVLVSSALLNSTKLILHSIFNSHTLCSVWFIIGNHKHLLYNQIMVNQYILLTLLLFNKSMYHFV